MKKNTIRRFTKTAVRNSLYWLLSEESHKPDLILLHLELLTLLGEKLTRKNLVDIKERINKIIKHNAI